MLNVNETLFKPAAFANVKRQVNLAGQELRRQQLEAAWKKVHELRHALAAAEREVLRYEGHL